MMDMTPCKPWLDKEREKKNRKKINETLEYTPEMKIQSIPFTNPTEMLKWTSFWDADTYRITVPNLASLFWS